MIVHIERTYLPKQTNGVLYVGELELQTLECPWRDNQPFVSCIAEGHYVMTPWVSPKFGKCYIIDGGTVGKTEGARAHCLFHPASFVQNLQGCIALGNKWKGDMLMNSAVSCEKLFDYLNWQEAKLVISEAR